MLRSAPWQRFAWIRQGGMVLAIGRIAMGAGWAGLTAIDVHSSQRRRGLATAIVIALVAEAAHRAASGSYLQAEDGDAAALALYRTLGFAVSHGYHYRGRARLGGRAAPLPAGPGLIGGGQPGPAAEPVR